MNKYINLKIGDVSDNGQIVIIDEDRLCYLVKSTSRGAYGLRTISKSLLGEYIDYFGKHPDATANDARDALSGLSDIDKFEYGYSSTLRVMALMALGQIEKSTEQSPTIPHKKREFDFPLQQIFYGAPGTGKSHRIKEIIQEQGIDEKEQVIRTTFHPDSDYSTFVGCYKPIMKSVPQTYVVEGKEKPVIDMATGKQSEKDEIVYDYTPQSFVQAYTKAWTNPSKPIILVIEEINRGNCAQIFGDIFQLLDRGDDHVSEYEIKPDKALENYLRDYFTAVEDVEIPEQIKAGEIMKLPANLFIWATMNTSDQSLFPIDSAFKRRWEWKYIKIAWPYKKNEDGSFKMNENGEKIHFNYQIEGDHNWWDFLQQINAIIDKMTNSADKQLGYFFAKAKDDVISYDTFVSKVCFYLWNDIFKTYALDEQQGDLFSYTDNEGKKKQLTFPAFYDGDGNVIKEVVEAFIGNVMRWNTDTKNDKA